MRPSEMLERKRDEVRAAIARHPVSNPRLFGSVARGEDTEESDLDILVDLPENVSYYALFRLQDELTEILGCRVEVNTLGRPNSRFANRIAPDLRPI